ncbi:bacteriophage P2 GPQ capsid (plasmid) [Blastomonas sp. RAC04]|nr:bacteriophage P2 GPQ capsid [Blastomonas sp. RAC04]
MMVLRSRAVAASDRSAFCWISTMPVEKSAAAFVARINVAATRDDMLAAHHVPPKLIGIIPQNNGGFGDAG